MRFRAAVAAALLVAALTAPLAAHADVVRFALLVGHNRGQPNRIPLRWAEPEALELGGVLAEVGQISRDRMMILTAPTRAEVLAALDRLEARASAERRAGGHETVLVVYFSGHADGEQLELGEERLGFAELRDRLERFDASVRIGLVDACMGGGVLREKGGRPGPSVDVEVTDRLRTSGVALIASSGPQELSQESDAAGGSYFTRAVVAGLRGAADEDGDLRVTLSELYRYARDQTVRRSAESLVGPQHPAYELKLRGDSEIVLSTLAAGGAYVELDGPLDGHFLVWRSSDGHVLAEIQKVAGRTVRVLVPPGTVTVAERTGGALRGAQVELHAGETHVLGDDALRQRAVAMSRPRGGVDAGPARSLWAAYGVSAAAVRNALLTQEVGLAGRWDFEAFSLWARMSYGRTRVDDEGLRYRYDVAHGELWVGRPWRFYELDFALGGGLGAAYYEQRLEVGDRFRGGLLSPRAGARLEVLALRPFSVMLGWDLALHLLQVNGVPSARLVPVASMGVGYRFR